MKPMDWSYLNALRDVRAVRKHKGAELVALQQACERLEKGCPASEALPMLKAEVLLVRHEMEQLDRIIDERNGKE